MSLVLGLWENTVIQLRHEWVWKNTAIQWKAQKVQPMTNPLQSIANFVVLAITKYLNYMFWSSFNAVLMLLFYTKFNVQFSEKGMKMYKRWHNKCFIIVVLFRIFNHWKSDTKIDLSETSTLANGLAETSVSETSWPKRPWPKRPTFIKAMYPCICGSNYLCLCN